MGAKLFRQARETQTQTQTNKNAASSIEKEYFSLQKLDEDFNRLYLESRAKLHAITANPSEELLANVSRCLKTNAKFMENSFKEATLARFSIVDVVTDRLSHRAADHNGTIKEFKSVDSYLRPRGNRVYENQDQP